MTAFYHLPGLFEFYDLYRAFLPLYRQHRAWFYPWCAIGSLYGAPADCLWGGGRVPDEGACFELGYCYAKGKRCIGYKTDARSFIDGFDNVMLHGAPEIVLRNEDELRAFFG